MSFKFISIFSLVMSGRTVFVPHGWRGWSPYIGTPSHYTLPPSDSESDSDDFPWQEYIRYEEKSGRIGGSAGLFFACSSVHDLQNQQNVQTKIARFGGDAASNHQLQAISAELQAKFDVCVAYVQSRIRHKSHNKEFQQYVQNLPQMYWALLVSAVQEHESFANIERVSGRVVTGETKMDKFIANYDSKRA